MRNQEIGELMVETTERSQENVELMVEMSTSYQKYMSTDRPHSYERNVTVFIRDITLDSRTSTTTNTRFDFKF